MKISRQLSPRSQFDFPRGLSFPGFPDLEVDEESFGGDGGSGGVGESPAGIGQKGHEVGEGEDGGVAGRREGKVGGKDAVWRELVVDPLGEGLPGEGGKIGGGGIIGGILGGVCVVW